MSQISENEHHPTIARKYKLKKSASLGLDQYVTDLVLHQINVYLNDHGTRNISVQKMTEIYDNTVKDYHTLMD